MTLPSIETLKELPKSEQKIIFDQLFEPCETLSNFIFIKIIPQINNNFKNYSDFINLVRSELLQLIDQQESSSSSSSSSSVLDLNDDELNQVINKIISAHPRLGEPKKQNLSIHSSNEQKSLTNDNDDPEILNKLKELNEKYEKNFPGLRYVVFVNGRNKIEIINDMNKRINRNDIILERKEAFNAMCDIALDRSNKLGIKL